MPSSLDVDHGVSLMSMLDVAGVHCGSRVQPVDGASAGDRNRSSPHIDLSRSERPGFCLVSKYVPYFAAGSRQSGRSPHVDRPLSFAPSEWRRAWSSLPSTLIVCAWINIDDEEEMRAQLRTLVQLAFHIGEERAWLWLPLLLPYCRVEHKGCN